MVRYRHTLAGSFCAFLAAFAVAAIPAGAAPVTLTDGNSSLTIDPTSTVSVSSWIVGTQQTLGQQSLWYRVGPTGGQTALGLPGLFTLASAVAYDTNGDSNLDQLTAKYAGTGITMSVTWMLRGGLAGSRTSDIGEIITINNTSGADLDFHLYNYIDMNMSGAGDTASIAGGNTATQKGGSWQVQAVYTGSPTLVQVGLTTAPNSILSTVSSATTPAVLTGAAGPVTGDAAWALQWDRTIANDGSMLLSTDTNIAAPEPATLTLMAGGLAMAWTLRRKKEKQ